MSEKILKFDNIRVNKKEFPKSKQPIELDLVNIYQRVVSGKFKHNENDLLVTKKVKLLNRYALSYLK